MFDVFVFFFQAEDGIRDYKVTGVQTCALPISWYVEDDAQSCTAMRALLQRWGCNVPLAGGPAEALALAAPGEAPQLVLLDVRLGQLHGPDVYAQLCQRWGQSPPVILVTAERDGMVRRQAAERGWGFLAKPVRPPALRALKIGRAHV